MKHPMPPTATPLGATGGVLNGNKPHACHNVELCVFHNAQSPRLYEPHAATSNCPQG
eukprot:CAMPEP_0204347236 /NCGR_PEP_ID=MMETSP0469-20131031/27792_1 /ASSEMBLY_ACC=CAM_ASM_000384 /TAXON_ID=2969 /ORGANISM="Oxyrrhis marina" /LENGTH=56 /DNA_ID=CAMNT_0051333007 /DNA_START=90 /DNA_END=257 /DNA_ORIENTATION=+